MSKKLNRRKFLEISAYGTAGLIISSCSPAAPAPATPEVVEKPVEVTRVVEVAGTPQVQIVTATPAPVNTLPAEQVLGVLPRNETFIADMLTGRVGSPGNFNEWVGWKNRDRGMQQLGNEPLWSVDFASGEIIPGTADGNPVYNEDFTECTIKLRKGINWSDGEPVTSADLVFTVETLKSDSGFGANTFMNENVASVEAVDEQTALFKLNSSNSRFHTTFLDRWGCTWIMPKHIFEPVEDKVQFEFNPFVGTGPYKLHSFDPNGFWTIWEKREDWANTPTGILYGEPQPKYVVFQNFANEGAKILAQLTHKADVLNLSSDGLKALLAQSKSSRAYQLTYPWVVNNDPCITGITYNSIRSPFDLKDVRWALTLAINIGEYIGLAVDGTGTMSPVHIPHLSNYPTDFIKPMQGWLADLEIDLGNGEMFKVYDPEAHKRVVEYAKSRGYTFPEDAASIEKAFGIGWYKYAPEAAEKLLLKNGFSKNADGKWLLPDGKPWKIVFMTSVDTTTHSYRNAMAATTAWKKFGIETEMYPTDAGADLMAVGDFDVSGNWPAQEPWGAGPDLYRVLNYYNSEYIKPKGERTAGHPSRWSSPEMDAVISQLRETDPTDYEATVAIGIEGLKEAILNMPGTPTYGYTGFVGWDTTYWSNWPGAENAYTQPYTHWGPFKYMTPFLKSTGA
jgi:peptide/nickel transport system substrate-binding protein